MDIQTALKKLYSMHQFSIKLGLERIQSLLDYIGNPQNYLKCFHIAGSNGKGSTVSFIASILMGSGYKVGLYTSPHFVRFNERIRVNGKEIEDDYIAEFVSSLDQFIKEHEPTFFEVTTALAFKYFQESKIDIGVIETGLGGRLDATNVLNPLVSIITSIGFEHTNILGTTLDKITEEKAGIIKPDTYVFSGYMPIEAEEIIRAKAQKSSCKYFQINKYSWKEAGTQVVNLKNNNFHIYSTPLQGDHQLLNAALAVKSVNEVLKINDGIVFNNGIRNVVKNSGIQGRYEVLNQYPKIIFDSAHNPDGVRSFINEFSKEYMEYEERILIFGVMKDKDIATMLILLQPYFNKIYISRVNNERAATIEEITEIGLSLGFKLIPLDNPEQLIERFYSGKAKKCLVLLGSMYLLGDVKSKILLQKSLTK